MNREEVMDYIEGQYAAKREFPWVKTPDFAVFRHKENNKWFALLMGVDKSKFDLKGTGIIDVINLKCDDIMAPSLRSEKGIFPAYHMNKEKWVSVSINDVSDEKLKFLIDISHSLTK